MVKVDSSLSILNCEAADLGTVGFDGDHVAGSIAIDSR